jgi:hypothetical protein
LFLGFELPVPVAGGVELDKTNTPMATKAMVAWSYAFERAIATAASG